MTTETIRPPTAPNAERVNVICDLCGCDRHKVLYPLRRSCIVRCEKCGFHYVSPRVAPEIIRKRLQGWAEQDVVDAERLRIAFEANTLELFGSHLDRVRWFGGGGGGLLDVGCATGALLELAARKGWQVEGLEIGRASAEYARNRLNVRIHEGSLYDFYPRDGTYRVVTMLEVIEHLESPASALSRIHKWLEPGGLLLLSTPNFDSLYRRLFGADWWVVNCEEEHIMLFTAKTLHAALRSAGFEPVWTQIRGIDLAGIAKNLRPSGSRPGLPGGAQPAAAPAAAPATQDYYASRNRKERVKAALGRAGMLSAARRGMRALDWSFSRPWSPLFACGEQLVCIARKTRTEVL